MLKLSFGIEISELPPYPDGIETLAASPPISGSLESPFSSKSLSYCSSNTIAYSE